MLGKKCQTSICYGNRLRGNILESLRRFCDIAVELSLHIPLDSIKRDVHERTGLWGLHATIIVNLNPDLGFQFHLLNHLTNRQRVAHKLCEYCSSPLALAIEHPASYYWDTPTCIDAGPSSCSIDGIPMEHRVC